MARRALSVLMALAASMAVLVPAQASRARAFDYIVVLKESVAKPGAVAREHARGNGARLGHIYSHALKGYSATMSEVAATRLASDDRVAYVEVDGIVHKTVDEVTSPQAAPTWGLDRIDQPSGTNGSYGFTTTGAGVTAYVIDSGITDHGDFNDRLKGGTDFVGDGKGSADCDGHGTHVAGTIGSETWGVAKDVNLWAIRVLNCSGSGSWSGVIAGVDWVTANHIKPAVANMSLGGGASTSVDQAVSNSISAGVSYAVAAGNGNSGGKAQDACGYSPARTPNALTVGATNSSDTKASWSNYGACLDLFAPGVAITSTTMDGGTDTWSGTSMATPHVAGVAALYLQSHAAASPAAVAAAMRFSATPNVVIGEGAGSPDLLLYSFLTDPPLPDPETEPGPSGVVLTAEGSKVKGVMKVALGWTPVGGAVDIYRNDQRIVRGTGDDGSHTDSIGKGSGTYTYVVCAAETTSCSNSATVVF